MIIALAHEPATGAARADPAADRHPGPARRPTSRCLQEALVDCGVVAEVEERIADHVAAALSALRQHALDPDGVRELTQMAHTDRLAGHVSRCSTTA